MLLKWLIARRYENSTKNTILLQTYINIQHYACQLIYFRNRIVFFVGLFKKTKNIKSSYISKIHGIMKIVLVKASKPTTLSYWIGKSFFFLMEAIVLLA